MDTGQYVFSSWITRSKVTILLLEFDLYNLRMKVFWKNLIILEFHYERVGILKTHTPLILQVGKTCSLLTITDRLIIKYLFFFSTADLLYSSE